MDKQFDRVDEILADLKWEIKGLRNWLELSLGGFQTQTGKRGEDLVASAFSYRLNRNDIRPEGVKLRQRITDIEGVVYRAGKTRQVDIIATGQGLIVFAVKSTADRDDIEDLADKVKLVRHLNPGQPVEGILVMPGADTEQCKWCLEHGLRLIP